VRELAIDDSDGQICLVFFGVYCLLIGYLIFRSTYNLASGILGEGSVCLWLLAIGVNVQRWKQQAGARYVGAHNLE
jgi:hypothetical protein